MRLRVKVKALCRQSFALGDSLQADVGDQKLLTPTDVWNVRITRWEDVPERC